MLDALFILSGKFAHKIRSNKVLNFSYSHLHVYQPVISACLTNIYVMAMMMITMEVMVITKDRVVFLFFACSFFCLQNIPTKTSNQRISEKQ